MKTRRVLLDAEFAPLVGDLFQDASLETDIVTPKRRLLKPLLELGDYSAMLVSNKVPIHFDVLEVAAKRLQVIGVFGDDLNNIDVADASRKGILVKVTEYGNSLEASYQALRLMVLLLSRSFRARTGKKAMLVNDVAGYPGDDLTGFELAGSVVGLIGCGNVAQLLAAALRPHCSRVIGYDNNPRTVYEKFHRRAPLETPVIEYAQLSEVLEYSDVISIHTAGETRVFQGKELYFASRRPYIVNTSRDGNVDEASLLSALADKRIRGAAFTVPADAIKSKALPEWAAAFVEHGNVVIAPSVGGPSADTQKKQIRKLARSVIRYLIDRDLSMAVNPMDVIAGRRRQRFPVSRGEHRSPVPILWGA